MERLNGRTGGGIISRDFDSKLTCLKKMVKTVATLIFRIVLYYNIKGTHFRSVEILSKYFPCFFYRLKSRNKIYGHKRNSIFLLQS